MNIFECKLYLAALDYILIELDYHNHHNKLFDYFCWKVAYSNKTLAVKCVVWVIISLHYS